VHASFTNIAFVLVDTGSLLGTGHVHVVVQYARKMQSPIALGDSDSRYHTICGIAIHYKSSAPSTPQVTPPSAAATDAPDTAVALYHGFGANLWSWMQVQQQLADDVRALVTAHDMPGFGLTERSRSLRAYRLQTNGDIGREVQNLEWAARAGRGQQPLHILVGHSLGCAAIATSLVADPDGIDGIVLVSPAIMVSPFAHRAHLASRTIRCAPCVPGAHTLGLLWHGFVPVL
jgi:pimeloyl-ACP methyl ester carboxylesterase